MSAPYCRNCLNKVYHINSKGTEELISVGPKDITILNNIDSIQEFTDFISKFNSLARAIQIKMVGSNADSNLEKQLKGRIERNGQMNDSERNEFSIKFSSLISMSKGTFREAFSLDSIAVAKKN